ncbi:MAG: chromosome partition protein MukE [Kofleriaceae bacterium]|nr:chromosome partition protein MukE [Myxococcales bacterium]MCB9562542.1 chromosome partition protein MukE [Kofleriaceae bacterium]
MTERRGFAILQDVLLDDEFPALDLALRGGRHVDRDDLAWYQLLTDGQDLLEPFYRRYGCELIHKSDGYFYLLPSGDKLPRRHLKVGDMVVGQALALLYLDPASVERGGVVTRDQVVAQLVAVLGEGGLVRTFHARKRRVDERVAHKLVRARIAEAVRRLAALGFVDLVDDAQLRLRAALLRFAEPVRGTGSPGDALAKLVADGEVALAGDGDGDGDGDGGEGDGDEGEGDDGDDAEVADGDARDGDDDERRGDDDHGGRGEEE